ncbi:MAG: diacylglycerol kinase family lipid kinase [Candidatus Didemnitutus sp.]|nr:diacylglycerol kinase family lipid kinase [Candidatus Didemnitutus sp.]
MKVRFIFNPHSGRNRRDPSLRERAAEFIAHCGWDGTVVSTERPRHATELARRAVDEGCELVVAIGGDGTMNEVATALVNTPATFGLIPCGSGNGLGRHLGIPGAGRGAFRTLSEGCVRAIDTGRVNSNPFFNAMGLGFEADIAVRFSRLTSRGLAGYVRVGVPAFFSHRAERVTLTDGTGRTELEAFTLAVLNSDQYGNDAVIAPGARVDDGQLDLIAVPQVGVFAALGLVGRLALRSFDRGRGVVRRQGTHFVLERPQPGWIHTDGEPRAETSRLEISVLPRSLRVMVPRPAIPSARASR